MSPEQKDHLIRTAHDTDTKIDPASPESLEQSNGVIVPDKSHLTDLGYTLPQDAKDFADRHARWYGIIKYGEWLKKEETRLANLFLPFKEQKCKEVEAEQTTKRTSLLEQATITLFANLQQAHQTSQDVQSEQANRHQQELATLQQQLANPQRQHTSTQQQLQNRQQQLTTLQREHSTLLATSAQTTKGLQDAQSEAAQAKADLQGEQKQHAADTKKLNLAEQAAHKTQTAKDDLMKQLTQQPKAQKKSQIRAVNEAHAQQQAVACQLWRDTETAARDQLEAQETEVRGILARGYSHLKDKIVTKEQSSSTPPHRNLWDMLEDGRKQQAALLTAQAEKEKKQGADADWASFLELLLETDTLPADHHQQCEALLNKHPLFAVKCIGETAAPAKHEAQAAPAEPGKKKKKKKKKKHDETPQEQFSTTTVLHRLAEQGNEQLLKHCLQTMKNNGHTEQFKACRDGLGRSPLDCAIAADQGTTTTLLLDDEVSELRGNEICTAIQNNAVNALNPLVRLARNSLKRSETVDEAVLVEETLFNLLNNQLPGDFKVIEKISPEALRCIFLHFQHSDEASPLGMPYANLILNLIDRIILENIQRAKLPKDAPLTEHTGRTVLQLLLERIPDMANVMCHSSKASGPPLVFAASTSLDSKTIAMMLKNGCNPAQNCDPNKVPFLNALHTAARMHQFNFFVACFQHEQAICL